MLLANSPSSGSWGVQGTPTLLKIQQRAVDAQYLPNSKLGLFLLEKPKLEKSSRNQECRQRAELLMKLFC